jgi:phosphoglucomutase
MDYRENYKNWLCNATNDTEIVLELKDIQNDEDAIKKRFSKDLAFGTGGLRGTIGAGPGRMNIYTVKKMSQGLSAYLKENFIDPSIAIAYDSRKNSLVFAKAAAEVFAQNGIF